MDDEYDDFDNQAEVDATARRMIAGAFNEIRAACISSKTARQELVDAVKRATLGMPPGPVGPEYLARELFEKPYKLRG